MIYIKEKLLCLLLLQKVIGKKYDKNNWLRVKLTLNESEVIIIFWNKKIDKKNRIKKYEIGNGIIIDKNQDKEKRIRRKQLLKLRKRKKKITTEKVKINIYE